MVQIAFPSDGSMIFDEAHYVPAALATLNGVAANAEHPPLPKLISAFGIWLLGNNWFGWRFPQILMQIAALYLFYLIAKRLLGDPWALGATMLLGLDTIFFIHGGALLIDMPSFLFSFLAIELYFRKRYSWSGVAWGLAFAAREMALFYFATLMIYHAVKNWHLPNVKLGWKSAARYLLIITLVFSVVMFSYDLKYLPAKATSVTNYVNSNVVLGANGSAITTILSTSQSTSKDVIWNPVQHVLFIVNYHGPNGLVINTPYAPYDYAWNWILPCDPINQTCQPFNSPTYFRVDVDVSVNGVATHYVPMWYNSQANLAVWYGFIPALIALGYAIRKRKEWETATLIVVGMLANFVPWVVLSAVVRRIGFNYYFIYTLPFVALGLAYMWRMLPAKYGKPLLALNVFAALAFFLWFFPVRPMP